MFAGKNKKNIINLLSAENAQRVVKVKCSISSKIFLLQTFRVFSQKLLKHIFITFLSSQEMQLDNLFSFVSVGATGK